MAQLEFTKSNNQLAYLLLVPINGVVFGVICGCLRLLFRGVRLTGEIPVSIWLSVGILVMYTMWLIFLIFGGAKTLKVGVIGVSFVNFVLIIISVGLFVIQIGPTSSILCTVGGLSVQKVVWHYYELLPLCDTFLFEHDLDLTSKEKSLLIRTSGSPEELELRVIAKKHEVEQAAVAALEAKDSIIGRCFDFVDNHQMAIAVVIIPLILCSGLGVYLSILRRRVSNINMKVFEQGSSITVLTNTVATQTESTTTLTNSVATQGVSINTLTNLVDTLSASSDDQAESITSLLEMISPKLY